jgi:hypothetical protein
MTADDQTRPAAARLADPLRRARRRLRAIAGAGLRRVAPAYASKRSRRAGMAAALARLQTDVEHLGKRQAEQIGRLEDLVSELVLTAESLRREIARVSPPAQPAREETPRAGGVEG